MWLNDTASHLREAVEAGGRENVHAVREVQQQYINQEPGGMIDKCGKVQKRETIAPDRLDTV